MNHAPTKTPGRKIRSNDESLCAVDAFEVRMNFYLTIMAKRKFCSYKQEKTNDAARTLCS